MKQQIDFTYGFPAFSKEKQPLKFNHNKVPVADIWSFWNYIIKEYAKTIEKKDILFSLLEQSKTFYQAAENADLRSKPLLYYYSFLNFAKLTIELESNFEKHQRFDHGINPADSNTFVFASDSVDILKLNSGETSPKKRSVCYELMNIVEAEILHTFPPKLNLKIKDLLKHCVGVHRTYANVYREDEIFSRIEKHELIKEGKKLIYKALLQDTKKHKNFNALKSVYGTNLIEDGEKVYFIVEYQMNSYQVTNKVLFELSHQIRKFGIWQYINRDGYKFYLSSCVNNRYSPSFIIFVIMFYLGSITRYHPYLYDDIFSQSDQWVISEFLYTQPKQFLFLTTSKVLGVELREPYSKF